jgi:CBS domain-containing protein
MHAAPQHPKDPRFVFFSNLLGLRVRGPAGEVLGRVTDLIVATGEAYPPVESLVLKAHGKRLQIAWGWVAAITPQGLQVQGDARPSAPPAARPEGRLSLREDLLDRQIVDVEGAKLVRVNDLHFIAVNGALRLAHVDVGFRGLVRRMGWEPAVDGAIALFSPGATYFTSDQLLAWKLVQPLDRSPGKVRLDVAQRALAGMHPADLAEILEELDRDQRTVLLQRLDVETAAGALEEAPAEITAQLLEEVPPEKAAHILEEMAPNEAADVLGELPTDARAELLDAMDRPEAREVEQLLEFPPDSAGGLMTPNRIELRPVDTVAAAIAEVRRRADEIPLVYEIFVTDDAGVLKGICTLKDLVLADGDTPLERIAREAPATVDVDDSLHDVAVAAAKYSLFSVPVVDRMGVLRGMVTVDDILPEVLGAR